MKRKDPIRATRTSRYFLDAVSTGRLDGVRLLRRPLLLDRRRALLRLGVYLTPKQSYDAGEIARWIENCRSDTLFFCDCSLFDNRTDNRIWDALLAGDGNMVLIPQVRMELEPWIAANPAHPVVQALRGGNRAVWHFEYDELADWEIAAVTYYANLLGLRKRLVEASAIEFELANGHPPAYQELERLKQRVHQKFGARGYLLARKGADKPLGPTYFTDEFLVCVAVVMAISAGRPVVVLTKDEDVQEQFYKLQWLLDTHYRGMLLADRYAVDPLSFSIRALPRIDPLVEQAFYLDHAILIERSRQLLDDVLPAAWLPLPLSCLILGVDWLTSTAFIAERGMSRLLRIKGETGGLNVDRLGGRNCHIWTAPINLPWRLRDSAIIAQDRRLQLPSTPSVAVPLLDFQQAIMTAETVPRVMEFYPELVEAPDAWID
jgi:hypothetical protein